MEKESLTDRAALNAAIETHLIPLRCIILMIMVALMKNNMKKSTISAKNLWTGEGMLYSRPRGKNRKQIKCKSAGSDHYEAKHANITSIFNWWTSQLKTISIYAALKPGLCFRVGAMTYLRRTPDAVNEHL